jgi:hypothetical protein
MSDEARFTVFLDHVRGREFSVRFDWRGKPGAGLDEPAASGHRRASHSALILGAAVGNCIGVSLLGCLDRLGVELRGIQTTITGVLVRDEGGRVRIGRLDVQIALAGPTHRVSRLARCLETDEEYRLIAESVQAGIPVDVHVSGANGERIAG